jgi:hypothetical protein
MRAYAYTHRHQCKIGLYFVKSSHSASKTADLNKSRRVIGTLFVCPVRNSRLADTDFPVIIRVDVAASTCR